MSFTSNWLTPVSPILPIQNKNNFSLNCALVLAQILCIKLHKSDARNLHILSVIAMYLIKSVYFHAYAGIWNSCITFKCWYKNTLEHFSCYLLQLMTTSVYYIHTAAMKYSKYYATMWDLRGFKKDTISSAALSIRHNVLWIQFVQMCTHTVKSTHSSQIGHEL
jgi:hypothetical protein